MSCIENHQIRFENARASALTCTCIANLDQTVLAAQAEKSGDWRPLPPVGERGDLASLSSENRRRMKANFASSQPVLRSVEHHSRQYGSTQSAGATDARCTTSCTGATEEALFTIYFQFNFSEIRCKFLYEAIGKGADSWKRDSPKENSDAEMPIKPPPQRPSFRIVDWTSWPSPSSGSGSKRIGSNTLHD